MDLNPDLIFQADSGLSKDPQNGTFQPQSGAASVSRSPLFNTDPVSYPEPLENASNEEFWSTGTVKNVMTPSDLNLSQDLGLMMPMESLGAMIEFPDDIDWVSDFRPFV